MFSAFLPVRLLSDYPYPLECLTCYDNFLLVGTKQGLLLVYELTPKATNHPEFFIPNLNCLSSHSKVIPFTQEIASDTVSSSPIPAFFTHVKITRTLGKKPIIQLTAIPEFDILLALADGRMSVYQLQNCQLITSVPNSKNAGLFTHCIEHSKLPIVSSWNMTDNSLSFDVSHSSSTESILSESKSRQLSKSNSLELRICVVVKRHLYFWRWNPNTREFVCPGGSDDLLTSSWPNELTTPEVVRSVTFCGLSKLIVGHRGEYLLINIGSGEMQFISAPGKNQLPIVTSLSHCLDLTNLNECDPSWTFNKSHFPKNSTTMGSFIGSENSLYQSPLDFTESDSNKCPSNHYQPMLPGSCSFLGIERDDVLSIISPFHEFKSIFQIKWSNVPYQIHIYPPYIIGIMDNALEIRIIHPNKLIQQLAITRVTAMCHSNGWFYASTAPATTTALFTTDSSPHSYRQNSLSDPINNDSTPVRGKNTNGSEVWLILSANRLRFIQDLVKQKEFNLAICLAKTALYSGQNAVETSQITILYGIHLYHEKKYSEALNLFTEQLINPIHILGLFPGMLSEQEQHQIVYPCDIKIINSSQMIDAYEPLITYLLTWRRLLKQQSNNVKLFIKPSEILNSTTLDRSKLSLSNNKNEQHHSDTADEFKCYSIKDITRIILPFTRLLELIDTSLLKCYLSTNTARVAPLLRQENACILDESVKTLLKHKRYQELIMLYQSRGLHREALSILQQFNIIRAKQFGNAVSITETEVKLPFTITLDENMNNVELIEQLGHPKRIIHYFIHYLNAYHLNLLTDYSKSYIIRYHPISWMRIVYCWEKKLNMKYRSEILENVLNDKDKKDQFVTFCSNYRSQILHFMEQYAAHLIIPYLEMIIFVQWNIQHNNDDDYIDDGDDTYDEDEDGADEDEVEEGESEEHGGEDEESNEAKSKESDYDNRSNLSTDQITTENYEKEQIGRKITEKSKCKLVHHLNENHGELKQSVLRNFDPKLNKYSPLNVLRSKIPSASQLSCASSLDSMQSGCISPGKCSSRFKDILTNSLWPLPDQHGFKRSRLVNLIMNSSHKENNPSKIYDPDILPPIPQYPSYIDVCDVHTRYAVALIRRAQTLQPANKPFAFKVSDEQPKSGAVARLRLRFVRFLMHPGANCSFSRLLAKCPCDAFFEERAFLLAKLNKHEQALSLWVHLLNDWNSAVNHCISVYQKGEHSLNIVEDNKTDNAHTDFGSSGCGCGAMIDEKLSLSSQNLQNFSPLIANSPSLDKNIINLNNKNHDETLINSSHNIFFLLMQICLQPTEPASLGIVLPSSPSKFTPFTPKPKKALEILHQFSAFVDPVKVIRITPTVALSSVGNYLKNTFICQESTLNQLVFLQNAAKSELIASCTDRIKATSNHFSVLPSTRCRTCRRRIGNSAFVRQPTSDELEHYGCCKDLIEKR
ncbi:hypothetical protein MN116_007377 [Schistosoma mekongi]|uniref:CNH domain-containing protein n=1 Tax=Schistosoma mekongi TaxID=38744 RepID=A0AAE2D3K1_SCHME|nr:hypothetical protein MN116_007377 [Schistosoma mekongi]